MRRRFFVDQFHSGRAVLQGEAGEHLGRVLRAQAGQLYELSDGRELWLAKVEQASRQRVEFSLVEPIAVHPSRLRVSLLLSIVKFDRFEWCLEKATELSVAEVVPIAAERSEKGLVAAAAKRAGRWQKILVESAQQARRLAPPVLAESTSLLKCIAGRDPSDFRIVLSEQADVAPFRKILEPAKNLQSVALAIGPEGGWTEREFAALRTTGFQEASLGRSILRTETAVIAALACLNYALGEDS